MKKYLLFPFLSADYRAAEAWLNEQAEKGLRLVELGVFTSVSTWEETDKPRHYGIVLCGEIPDRSSVFSQQEPEFAELEELARASGWRYVDGRDFMRIFEAEPGTDPAPLHTDPTTELGLYRRLIVRRARNSAIFFSVFYAFLLLALLSVPQWGLVEPLALNSVVVCLCGGIPCVLWNLWKQMHYGARLRRDKEAAREGRNLEVPPVRRVYARSMADGIFGIVFMALLLAGSLADFLYCPMDTYIIAAMMGNALIRVSFNRRLYRRVKWPRYAGIALGVLLFVGAGWYAYRYTVDRDVHFRSRSPLLSYWDYYIFDGVEGIGEGSFVRCYRFEAGNPGILDWAYAEIREEEELKEGQPPAGYSRMAAENPAGPEHRRMLLAWEGHTVFLEAWGEDMTQPIAILLDCAQAEPGDAIS